MDTREPDTVVKPFIDGEVGASAIEYGLLAAAVAAVIVTAVALLGSKAINLYQLIVSNWT